MPGLEPISETDNYKDQTDQRTIGMAGFQVKGTLFIPFLLPIRENRFT